ncbi:sporulation protein Cse60 [Gemella sp. GH3]|uniref:sporulation protein Cse60 n=1 Tax=unclassified Gemella TaxID=2624949 RepID=UPI0015D071B2|nr:MULTISPECIES: sporulation protein Cse60 [unclassified Gemella]MBF0713538.1 sporulation protein Cse60 [Gemella sp. GH3.1]NYS50490.1 sporulation protein Cse60 [Gemella sp. GH3]
MEKVKIIRAYICSDLEEKVNNFIANVDVIDLQYSTTPLADTQTTALYSVMIRYKEK